MIVGRDEEFATLATALGDAASGGASVFVVRGEAGIGKSALVDQLCQEATRREFRVVVAKADPNQDGLPYEIVFRILEQLRAQQRAERSAPSALLDREHLGTNAIGLLATELFVELTASATPTLLVVDDVQWIDATSAAVLQFVLRRIVADPVMVVLTHRTSHQSSETLDGPLSSAGLGPSLREISLTPLQRDDALALFRELGVTGVKAESFVDLGGGVPLAIHEIAAQLHGGVVVPIVSVAERFESLLRNVGDSHRYLLLHAALEPDLGLLARIFGKKLQTSLDLGLSYNICSVKRDATGETVLFRHPLIRTALIQMASVGDVRNAHRTIADALDPVHDADRKAVHVGQAAVEGDVEAVAFLAGFADRARKRGAFYEASLALQRASVLSEDQVEKDRYALGSAEVLYFFGDPTEAVRTARAVLDSATDPGVLAEALRLYSWASMWIDNPSVLVRTTREYAAKLDGSFRVSGLNASAVIGFLTDNIEQGSNDAFAAEQLALEVGDEMGRLGALATLVWVKFLMNLGHTVVDQTNEIDMVCDFLLSLETVESVSLAHVRTMRLIMEERNDEASALLQRANGVAQRVGVDLSAAGFSGNLAELRWREGRWHEARLLNSETLGSHLLPRVSRAWTTSVGARIHAAFGNHELALDLVEQTFSVRELAGCSMILGFAWAAKAHMELCSQQFGEAARSAALAGKTLHDAGIVHPNMVLWQSDLVDALIFEHANDELRSVLDTVVVVNPDLDVRYPKGITKRGYAYLCNDVVEAETLFDESVELFQSISMPYEAARSLLCKAVWQKRNSQPFAEARSEATRIFRRLGSNAWLKIVDLLLGVQTESDLGVGGRDPSVDQVSLDSLTESELRVALAVGSGKANAEVADELFLSLRTVEFYLTGVYRKLGVKRRSDLVRAMSEFGPLNVEARRSA